MRILISNDGTVSMIYKDSIDLRDLGRPFIERVARVEPDIRGNWEAVLDLGGGIGEEIGVFNKREEALRAEEKAAEERFL